MSNYIISYYIEFLEGEFKGETKEFDIHISEIELNGLAYIMHAKRYINQSNPKHFKVKRREISGNRFASF